MGTDVDSACASSRQSIKDDENGTLPIAKFISARSSRIVACPSKGNPFQLLKQLDFGLDVVVDSSLSSPDGGESLPEKSGGYGSLWEHHFVSPVLVLVSEHFPFLRELRLSRCQFQDAALEPVLKRIPFLRYLDVSYSSIRTLGLRYIAEYCQTHLEALDVSGVFRLRRNKASVLVDIAENCRALKIITMYRTPDIVVDVQQQCLEVNPCLQLIGACRPSEDELASFEATI
ncbi:hypothetical protein HK102_012632 [Quaeritorhiza haematococci]|nr:hypothetical protein HK102_012632 [Quaeritorhiza haematococci]